MEVSYQTIFDKTTIFNHTKQVRDESELLNKLHSLLQILTELDDEKPWPVMTSSTLPPVPTLSLKIRRLLVLYTRYAFHKTF